MSDASEIIQYFENKELPVEIKIPGCVISNPKLFVETQINRINNGAPIIRKASLDALLNLKSALES